MPVAVQNLLLSESFPLEWREKEQQNNKKSTYGLGPHFFTLHARTRCTLQAHQSRITARKRHTDKKWQAFCYPFRGVAFRLFTKFSREKQAFENADMKFREASGKKEGDRCRARSFVMFGCLPESIEHVGKLLNFKKKRLNKSEYLQ